MNSLAISAVCMLYLVLTVYSGPVPDTQDPTAAPTAALGSSPAALGRGIPGSLLLPTGAAGSAPVASAATGASSGVTGGAGSATPVVVASPQIAYNTAVGVGNQVRAARQRQQQLDTAKLAAVREQLRALTAARPGYGPNRMAAPINNLILATVQAIDALHGYPPPPPPQPQPYYGFNPHNPYLRGMIPIEQWLIIEAYLAKHGYGHGHGHGWGTPAYEETGGLEELINKLGGHGYGHRWGTPAHEGTGRLEELLSKLDGHGYGHGYGQGWGTPAYGQTGRLGELIKLLILLKRGNPSLGQGQSGLLDRGWGNLGLGQAL